MFQFNFTQFIILDLALSRVKGLMLRLFQSYVSHPASDERTSTEPGLYIIPEMAAVHGICSDNHVCFIRNIVIGLLSPVSAILQTADSAFHPQALYIRHSETTL